MFFRGISKVSVDAKGRFSLPKQRRESLQACGVSKVVVTADPGRCLLIYPMNEWLLLEAQLTALPNAHPAARHFQRLYLGFASEVEFDTSGRSLLTSELREYAGIERKATLLGQGKKLELWDVDRFEEQSAKWADELNDLPADEVPEFIQKLNI